MIKKVLKCNKGEGYLSFLITLPLTLLVIAFALNVFPAFTTKVQLNQFASEVMREAEITGRVGSEVSVKVSELKKTLTPIDDIKWSASYINGTNKIGLNGKIEVTVSKTINIGFFDFVSMPLTLQSKEVGASEVYHK